jgi:hypothetical protein
MAGLLSIVQHDVRRYFVVAFLLAFARARFPGSGLRA